MHHKISRLKALFSALPSREALYQKIMELGKDLPPFQEAWKTEANRVIGCQSLMYLHSELREGKVYFYAASDALISAGLAALLLAVYSEEPPESILVCPPQFLEELGIPSALTPGRANGLSSLYLKMKQEALSFLLV
ncbi:MAG: SufE family protein [Chlamydiia bacterium]|nr:SufE family protein [Chlamydiia bacterium]